MTPATRSIAAVNSLDRAAFVARFGGIFERSPWVAEQAWEHRPFVDRDVLERTLQEVVRRAGRERQLELLRAHPRLGTRLSLSGFSRAEQADAGLAELTRAERSELEALNESYERQFGFPFIFAVRDASLRAILDSCRGRIGAEPGAEFDESLRQVFRIAAFRLADLC
jgi:2-oxo-4-hydroxy-4-carboxy-5-ureidoimidazoline decarboxylase